MLSCDKGRRKSNRNCSGSWKERRRAKSRARSGAENKQHDVSRPYPQERVRKTGKQFVLNCVSQFNLKFKIISHPRTNQKGWCDFLRCICFVHFALKICSAMRPAFERRAFIVHEALEMDTGEQRSERTTADRRQSIFRQRPQEHDERTVSKSHSLLFNNSVLYRFAIYPFWKYIKGIRTKYFLCTLCAYFLSLVVLTAGILCCTLCK